MAQTAYVRIHKDLSQVKTKVFFNLTGRQLICFGCGILVGLPLFFILNKLLPSSAAAVIMICVMMPFFLFGLYERNGQPLEMVLRYYIHSRFLRPKKRPYSIIYNKRNAWRGGKCFAFGRGRLVSTTWLPPTYFCRN